MRKHDNGDADHLLEREPEVGGVGELVGLQKARREFIQIGVGGGADLRCRICIVGDACQPDILVVKAFNGIERRLVQCDQPVGRVATAPVSA